MHLLRHIQVVVAGGAVGTQRYVNAFRQQLRNGRKPAAQLHVAGGIVGHGHASAPQQRPILRRHPYTVGGSAGHVKHPQIVHPLGRRLTVLGQAVLMLAFCLAEMNMHLRARLAAPRRRPRRHIGVAGILRVQAAVHPDAPAGGVVPVGIKLLQLAGALVFVIGVRRVKGLYRIAQIGLYTGVRHQLCRLPWEEIHVGKAGGAACQHLQQRQRRTDPDILPGQPCLHGKHAVKQPPLQRQIRANAPQQRHGGVGVGVYQSRQQQLSGHILLPVKVPLRPGGTHRGDHRAVDGHKAVADHALRRIDTGIFQQCFHPLISSQVLFSGTR